MSKARILAVDDQRYFRELIEGLLQEEGYDVQTVSSAEEALHVLEREAFDIVVTDLVMPGVDGTELVSRIKERLPEQEIVMVTGVVDVKTAVEAMKRGATDYILKPFDRNTLAASLEKILQRRRIQDEHARLITENLEYLEVLSIYERASGLYSTLSIEPLAERLIEGLCVVTRSQAGVLWLQDDSPAAQLTLKSARGLIHVEDEAELFDGSVHGEALDIMIDSGHPVLLPQSPDSKNLALFVPLKAGGKLVGIARLSDPLDGGEIGDRERVAAEKFSGYGATAVSNALRFRGLEHHSFRDTNTGAYTFEFFQDATRNEMQKAARFGRSFSMIHVDVGDLATVTHARSGPEMTQWLTDLAEQLGAALRSTDLLASRDGRHYDMLLPETDAVGAAVLKQRMRGRVERCESLTDLAPGLRESLAISAVTYPTDATQLESLDRVLEERLEQDRKSLLRTLEIGERSFSRAIDRLLEVGEPQRNELTTEATRLLLSEIERRPRDRGLLFLSPGEATLPTVREGLKRLRSLKTKTEIVLVGDDRTLSGESTDITCVSTRRAGTDRPFALYYGEGPVYAMVSAHRPGEGGMRVFHTDDRSLVEHLAFQFQKDLGLPLGAPA